MTGGAEPVDAGGGDGGAGGAGTAGEGGAAACTSSAECGAPGDCAIPRCDSGACRVMRLPAGFFVRFGDEPCWALVCDGKGGVTAVVDPRNRPPAAGDCQVRSCQEDGSVQTVPAAIGSSCGQQQQQRCDGAGQCVDCVGPADCNDPDVCVNGACQAPTADCSNHHKGGDETDVDCGGSCPACMVGADCNYDSDCASHACDFYAPTRCVASHCQDHHLDGDETDLDCGGLSCGSCPAYAGCSSDRDCSFGLCHTRFHFCLPDHCSDGIEDYGETGLDCGNGCYGCTAGVCVVNADCLSQACDANTQLCAADQCADHHVDGAETDVDCGGGSCAPCVARKKCLTTSDCAAGTSCAAGPYKVCN